MLAYDKVISFLYTLSSITLTYLQSNFDDLNLFGTMERTSLHKACFMVTLDFLLTLLLTNSLIDVIPLDSPRRGDFNKYTQHTCIIS